MDTPALGFDDPKTQGILALAAGLLQAGGPSRYPVPFGAALGQAMSHASQQQQQQTLIGLEQSKTKMLEQQLKQAQAQYALQEPFMKWAAQQFQNRGVTGAASGNPMVPGPNASVLAGSGSTIPSGPPQSAPPNAFGNIPDAAAAMMLSGLPGPMKIGEQMVATARGVPMRPGAPLVNEMTGEILAPPAPNPVPGYSLIPDKTNPSGWRTVPVPGAVEGAATQAGAITGATEAARSPFRVEMVTRADGSVVPTFLPSLPGYPSPSQPGAQPAQQAAPRPIMVPRPIPAPRPMNPTVVPAPAAAGGDPWASIPKLDQPSGLGQSTYQRGRMQGAAALGTELAKKNSDAAGIANERLVYNGQALDLLDTATTGKGALAIANVKNFLNSRVGIPMELMDKVSAGDANATIALNKDLINAATQKAKQAYGSRITQSEVMLQIKQASPNVDQPTATIRYLLQTDSEMSKYQIQKASDLGKYLKSGGDPYQFEGWHSKAFPMSASVAGVHLPKPNEQGGSSKVIDDLLKKYGNR